MKRCESTRAKDKIRVESFSSQKKDEPMMSETHGENLSDFKQTIADMRKNLY